MTNTQQLPGEGYLICSCGERYHVTRNRPVFARLEWLKAHFDHNPSHTVRSIEPPDRPDGGFT